jgi:hypothetical protein
VQEILYDVEDVGQTFGGRRVCIDRENSLIATDCFSASDNAGLYGTASFDTWDATDLVIR